MNKKAMAIFLSLAMLQGTHTDGATRKLTGQQKKYADEIAKICIDNWDEYGVLPSVCIGQTFVESGIGQACRGYNFWGINSGRGYNYSSVKEGTLAYLKVINNGCYKNAPHKKDRHQQIKAILNGGYCQPVGDYYYNFNWLVDNYNLQKYDVLLFEKLRAKKQKKTLTSVNVVRKKEQNTYYQTFKCKYDPLIPEHSIVVSEVLATAGTVAIWKNDVMVQIYDTVSDANIHDIRTLITSNKDLDGKEIKAEFNQAAKG